MAKLIDEHQLDYPLPRYPIPHQVCRPDYRGVFIIITGRRRLWRMVWRDEDPNDEPASVLLERIKAEGANKGMKGTWKQRPLNETNGSG
jgi:hypothetical protein